MFFCIRQEKFFKHLLFLPFLNGGKKRLIKMAKCSLCGKKVKAYFDLCYDCYNSTKGLYHQFAEPIISNRFMKEMGIIDY